MEWLNYHHLLYFWVVAKEGSIAKASETLRLAQPTISGQIHCLEESLQAKLFMRAGRNLVLTDVGRVAYEYADEIFGLGRELLDIVHGRPGGRPLRLNVGITDVLPKLMAFRLLKPAIELTEGTQISCHEDKPENLFAELSKHDLDLVLTDMPMSPAIRVKAFHHLLGECGITVFGQSTLAAEHRKGFPASLDGAPFLLPLRNSSLRRSLQEWFDLERVRPKVIGEFQDSALMKVFGQEGLGLFVAPTAIENEVCRGYRVAVVGRTTAVMERYYAVSPERKIKHPAVVAVCESARREVFASFSAHSLSKKARQTVS